tara:strand:+ start:4143 stop:4520 length:378 start_codon:yes stop_codon:yes gene_type:complete
MSKDKFLYTKDHEWINKDGDVAYIGITDYAQSELGDIIFVELPNVGDSFSMGDVFGTIEAVKTVADLFMPVSGTIVDINNKIEDDPDLINSDAFNTGWIVKIKIENSDECLELLNEKDYLKIINE